MNKLGQDILELSIILGVGLISELILKKMGKIKASNIINKATFSILIFIGVYKMFEFISHLRRFLYL